MPTKPYPPDTIDQGRTVLEAWKHIDTSLLIGSLDQASLASDLEQVNATLTQITALEAQLTSLRNTRDTLYRQVWDKTKRVRNGIKAIYGDDSAQYDLIGGTRTSDRKSPTRKPKTE